MLTTTTPYQLCVPLFHGLGFAFCLPGLSTIGLGFLDLFLFVSFVENIVQRLDVFGHLAHRMRKAKSAM